MKLGVKWGMAFAEFVLTCTLNAYFQEILCSNTGTFEAFYRAINSLPATMLTETMSTQLIKWGIDMSQYFLEGGIRMLQNLRDSLGKEKQLKAANGIQDTAKDRSAWVN